MYEIIKINDNGNVPYGFIVQWIPGCFGRKSSKRPMLKELNDYLFPQGWLIYSESV